MLMQYFDTIKNHNITLTNDQIQTITDTYYPYLIVVATNVINSCEIQHFEPLFEFECNNILWELDLTDNNKLFTGDWILDFYLSTSGSVADGFYITNDLIKIKNGCK